MKMMKLMKIGRDDEVERLRQNEHTVGRETTTFKKGQQQDDRLITQLVRCAYSIENI